MNSILKLCRIGSLALLAVLLAACGGGSKKSLLYGTASIGMPLANTPVTITDANGAVKTTTTSPEGTFAINVTDMKGPLRLKSGSDPFGMSQTLYSVLVATPQTGENLTANLSPLTTAVVALLRADGIPGNITLTDITSDGVKAAIKKLNGSVDGVNGGVNGVLAYLLIANGLTTNGTTSAPPIYLDPITTAYNPSNLGIDALNSELHLIPQADGSLVLAPTSNPNLVLTNGSLALPTLPGDPQAFVLMSGTATPTTPFNNPPPVANPTTTPALPLPANYLDWMSAELKNCLAAAVGSRYTSGYCTGINATTGAGIFDLSFPSSQSGTIAFDTALQAVFPDAAKTTSVGAIFGLPQTITFLPVTTAGQQLAQVRFPYTLTDGTRNNLTLTVRQVPTGITLPVLPDNRAPTWTIYSIP